MRAHQSRIATLKEDKQSTYWKTKSKEWETISIIPHFRNLPPLLLSHESPPISQENLW